MSSSSISTALSKLTARLVSRCFLSFLAVWTLVIISRFLAASYQISCGVASQREEDPARRSPPTREKLGTPQHFNDSAQNFSSAGLTLKSVEEEGSLMWAHQRMPRIRPCLNFSDAYGRVGVGPAPRKYMAAVVSGGLNSPPTREKLGTPQHFNDSAQNFSSAGLTLKSVEEEGSLMWAHQRMPRIRPCLNFSDAYGRVGVGPTPRKYMAAVVSGGLNQQRQQVVDAVLVARIIGATLVLPMLQVNRFWADESEFADIFDDRHFVKVLRDDVRIVSYLPLTHLSRRLVRAPLMPIRADEDWVRRNIQSKLGKEGILLLSNFNSRLTKNLSLDLQKLRCKVAFEAIKLRPEIEEIAERLVKRIGREGPYMALHLRLEKDVWVSTGCPTGLGEKADGEIEKARASNPRMVTARYKGTGRERYLAGMCPLNIHQVSRMLKAFGARNSSRIYWAGGEPFGGQKVLEPLRAQFPNLHNKWSLANAGELDDIRRKPSILAAVDYIVCLKSKAFIASFGGNMANSLQDHRIYMGYGMPIIPYKKMIVHSLMNKRLREDEIDAKIKNAHAEFFDFKSNNETGPSKELPISLGVRNCMCSVSTSS